MNVILDKTLIEEIRVLKNVLKDFQNGNALGEWINKKAMKTFFDYSDTAIEQLEKRIVTSKIGRRTFYLKSSVLEELERNIVKKKH